MQAVSQLGGSSRIRPAGPNRATAPRAVSCSLSGQTRASFVASVVSGKLRNNSMQSERPVAVRCAPEEGDMHSRALLCTSIVANSFSTATVAIDAANCSGADVIEIRLDKILDLQPNVHLKPLFESCKLPFIVTYRPKWEGGDYDGAEGPRLQTLRQAAQLGATYIDIEYAAHEAFGAREDPLPQHTQLIMSHHNFERTLPKAELQQIEAGMRAAGADIAKIAMAAEDISDAWTMIELLKEKSGPMISLSMGERGVATRILASKYGGLLTFGALTAGQESAPGQPTVAELKTFYRCNSHTASTQVFGIIGNPVKHSRSPVLHNASMGKVGFDGVYIPLLVDDMDSFMATFTDTDWAGFSVTIPHKESACRLSDPDPVAKAIGAVNTLVRTLGGRMQGHNTDWPAAINAIEEGYLGEPKKRGDMPLKGKTAIVLGTGGAARALAFGAVDRGAIVIIAGRSCDKAEALAREVGSAPGSSVSGCDIVDVQSGAVTGDVLINTTPLGMVGKMEAQTPVPQSQLKSFKLVFDAVYTPLETRLLHEAKAAGCIAVDGLEMFVGQAAEQFMYFTGADQAPVELMRNKVLESLAPVVKSRRQRSRWPRHDTCAL